MMFYWLIVLLFVVFFFAIHCAKSNEKITVALLLSFLFFFAIVVFRPLVVPDTEAYKKIFDDINNSSFQELFKSVDLLRKELITGAEFGFVLFVKALLIVLPNNYRLLFFVIALVEFIFLSLFAKRMTRTNSQRVDLFYYFLPYFGLMYFLVVLRGGLSLSVCLYAFSLTKNQKKFSIKNLIIALILYFIAFTFHRFALIFVVVELIYFIFPKFKKKTTYRNLWIITGIAIFAFKFVLVGPISSLLINVFSSNELLAHYSKYILNQGTSSGISFRNVFFWLLGGLVLAGNTEQQFIENKRYFNVYLMGLVVMGVFSLVPGASRITDYMFSLVPLMMINFDYDYKSKTNYYSLLQCSELVYGVLGVIIMIRL